MSQPPPLPPIPLAYADRPACPHCRSQAWEPVKFTWWGGLLGPKLLHHTKCNQCRKTFNRKTGQSNTTAIVLYQVVIGAICFGIGFALFFLR